MTVQINSFLPLNVKNGRLVLRYFTSTFILHLFSHIFFAASFVFKILTLQKDVQYSLFSPLEHTMLLLLGVFTSSFSIYFRFLGLWRRNESLNFWWQNVEIFRTFLQTNPFGVLSEDFVEIRKSCRNSFFTLVFGTGVFSAITIWMNMHTGISLLKGFFSMECLSLLFELWNRVFLLLRMSNTVWMCFFLKTYTTLFHFVQLKLKGLSTIFSEESHVTCTLNHKPTQIEFEVKECYNLYLKLDKQVQSFNYYFRKDMVSETLFGIFNLVCSTLIFLRYIKNEDKITLANYLLVLIPIFFAKPIYSVGTEGSLLTVAATGVLDQIHHFYRDSKGKLSLQLGRDLEMFALKIGDLLPEVDAGNYFIFNRGLFVTVTKIF